MTGLLAHIGETSPNSRHRVPPKSRRRCSCVLAAVAAVSSVGAKAMGDDNWTGNTNNIWDTTSQNWDTGTQTYSNGDDVAFSDTAANFNIIVTPGGVSPDQVTFANNANTYNLTGGSVSTNSSYSSKIFQVVAGGTVNLSNIETDFYTYEIVAGTLNACPNTILGGSYLSSSSPYLHSNIDVFTGATLTLDQGVRFPAAAFVGLSLGDAGTIEVKPGANILASLVSQLSNGQAATGILQLDAGSTFNTSAGNFHGSVTGTGTLILSSITSVGSTSAFVEPETLYIDSASNLSSGVNLAVNGGALVSVGEKNTGYSFPNVSAGAGVNISVTGTGYASSTAQAPVGALRGSDSGSDTWLGTVSVPTSGSISGGSGGTLTLAGAISGGTVDFSTDYNSVAILNAVNTYTGETQIGAPFLNTGKLQLGVANAINASSGLSFAGGGAGTLDLHGYSTSVAYLTNQASSPATQGTYYYTNSSGYPATGSASSSVITNAETTNATLNIIQAAGIKTFSGTITNGSSATTALNFSGSGNQVLTGNNTFTGGTTISSGTVTAGSATALGAGPILLAGGTLSLATTSGTTAISSLATPAFAVNAASSSYYPPSISGGTFSVTGSDAAGEANSAFTPVTLGAKGFLATFNYTPTFAYGTTTPAGGFTFTLQSNAATAVGGSGFGLGYSGIGNSLAVEFATLPFHNTASPPGESTWGNLLATTLETNGASTNPYTDFDNANGMQLNSETMNISLLYDATAQTLTEMISAGQVVPGGKGQPLSNVTAYYSHIYTGVNLASILGTNPAYVGFTGGTTTTTGFAQNISNFVFTNYTGTTTPTLLTNNINANSGVSTIQLGISSGHLNGSVGSITIASGAGVAVTSLASDSIPTHGILTTTGVSLSGSTNAWSGKLDLTNNSLDVQNGSITTLTNQVKQGYANGTWNASSGIISSTAAADSTHLTALGTILNTTDGTPTGAQLYGTGTTLGLFSGVSPAKTDVLIKYTYYGDANLDGQVDGSDYTKIDNGFNNHLTGWFNGDFNYDGVIDGSDYTLIDNAFNTQRAQFAAAIGSPAAIATAQIAGASAVPEPSAFAMLGLAVCGLTGRRRRRTSLATMRGDPQFLLH